VSSAKTPAPTPAGRVRVLISLHPDDLARIDRLVDVGAMDCKSRSDLIARMGRDAFAAFGAFKVRR